MFNTGENPTPTQRSLLSELSAAVGERKVKMGLLDSDSDDDYLDFLKKENPKTALSTTKTMKIANLDSDSGSGSGTESIADDYSDDSFATSEKSEDTIQAKLDSPKSLKSSHSARSVKSIPDNDDSSVDELLSGSKPFSTKTAKVDDSIDELLAQSNPFLKKTPRNDDLAAVTEDSKSPKNKSKTASPRQSKSPTPTPIPSSEKSKAISNPETEILDKSRRSSLNATEKTPADLPIPAPRSRASSETPDNLEKQKDEQKTGSLDIAQQESENPIPTVSEDKKEALKEIFATAIENENTSSQTITKKRPDSALGRRMQKLIESRRNGSAEGAPKLPDNYTGLGSTRALEDLEKFKESGLNEELNGARGQRKMAYLAWLKKKEETRKKEENARKKKAKKEQEEMAKKNKPKPKTVQAAKTMGSAGEGWLKNKEAFLKEQARKEREKKRKEEEEKKAAEEEKKANEKLVKQYRERKEKEYQEKARRQREIEQEKQRQIEEAKMEKRIQSAKTKTDWEKKKQKELKKQKKEQQALERELTQTQLIAKDEKIQNGRRAYEDWRRRKKLEANETKMWTLSYEDFTEEIRPFY